jgi:hypothetical protein
MSRNRHALDQPDRRSRVSRRVDAGFGLLLIVLAPIAMLAVDPGARIGAAVLGLVMIVLGVDALFAAARGRRSLVSRIGPLP